MEEKNINKKTVASDKPPELTSFQKFFGVSVQERIFFVQQLGLMLKSGISLSKALLTLSKQTKTKLMGLFYTVSIMM